MFTASVPPTPSVGRRLRMSGTCTRSIWRACSPEAIPFRWLPLRYVARCEPAARLVAASRRRRSWLAALSGRWAGGDHRAVKRRIREWLRLTCCGRMLDAGCGTGEL